MALFERAVDLTVAALADAAQRQDLVDVLTIKGPAHEYPIDYEQRHAPVIHSAANIVWVESTVLSPVTAQRKVLMADLPDEYTKFFKALYRKVRVKTYLTDRVLTGGHKTNREIRWEVHRDSVHFALRRECLQIERALVAAVCSIGDLPAELAAELEAKGLRKPDAAPTRCPITLDPMEYQLLREELLSPKAGVSSYQVGHMNPLKAVNDDPLVGHTAKNVAWVSRDGNRIQGHLTLEETRDLLQKIAHNYQVVQPVIEVSPQ